MRLSLPEDYPAARAAFLAAAEAAGARLLRVRVPAAEAPDLFIDFALLPRAPEAALLHFSGVHGVEGFLGSAVQSALLADLPGPRLAAPSLLFVHAVNPYGMQFHRRANAANVDLNRNFSPAPAENPGYRLFARFLEPRSPAEALLAFAGALCAAARLGAAKTAQAIASGQSEFPRGLFYSGREAQRELQLVGELLRAHLHRARRVAALDLHTGLGRSGGEMIFPDTSGDPEAAAFFASALGREMDLPGETSGTYSNRGGFSGLLRASLPAACVRYALQEIGTTSAFTVLRALRRENCEWHRRPPGALPSAKTRRAMLEAFFPRSPAWRENAVALGQKRWRETHEAMASRKWRP